MLWLIFALVCFVLAAAVSLFEPLSRFTITLIAAGLAFFTAARL